MRQIVAGLTGDAEGCTDLASELSRGDPVTLEMQDSDDEGTDPEDWTPDPTDAVPGERTHRVTAPRLLSAPASPLTSLQISWAPSGAPQTSSACWSASTAAKTSS